MTNFQSTPRAWAYDLRPGHVVAFRFPQSESQVRGKARPCLVIAIEDSDQNLAITLAYGTTATTLANRDLDFSLDDDSQWEAAGLHEATRFVLARRITVHANDARFHRGTRDSPIIGNLPGHRMNEFSSLIGEFGNGIFEDQIPGASHRRSTQRHRATSRHRSGSVIMHRREILVPARQPRGQERTVAHTIIVESRARRARRPTPSVI